MNIFKSLVGAKVLTAENLKPAIEKMKELLVGTLVQLSSILLYLLYCTVQ